VRLSPYLFARNITTLVCACVLLTHFGTPIPDVIAKAGYMRRAKYVFVANPTVYNNFPESTVSGGRYPVLINYAANALDNRLWSNKGGTEVISLFFCRESIVSKIRKAVYRWDFVFERFPIEVREDISSLGRPAISPNRSNNACLQRVVDAKFIDVNKSSLLRFESLISFFKRLPLFDQYAASDRASDKKTEGQKCNSNRRISDASIGFCCLIVSTIVFGQALRYGIYKARSSRQYAVAALFIVVFFPIAIQGSLSILNSASLDCSSEDVRVLSVIIPELELGDVKMQILFANLVVGADNAALQY
jgi:hypothetical protein